MDIEKPHEGILPCLSPEIAKGNVEHVRHGKEAGYERGFREKFHEEK